MTQLLRIFIAISLVIIIGCNKHGYETIPEDKAANLMVDITLADQVVNLYDPEDRDSIKILLTESLLKIHNLTQSELDTNLYLYMSDFDKYKKLSDRVLIKYDSLKKVHPE